MVVREKIIAGAVTFVKVYNRYAPVRGKRAARTEPTRESVLKINKKNAERDLSIKLNYNFLPGDIHATLTYAGSEPSREYAKKCLDNFKRKLKGLKWICVTEYENKRIHHHIVVSGIAAEEVQKIWKHGRIKVSILDGSGDYRKLAEYLIKETDKTFRLPTAVSRRRYNCSRSIKNPPVYREEVKKLSIEDDPVVFKGYYIDKDSIYRGQNLFNERPYLEYVLIAIDPERSRRVKGKKYKYHREPQYEKWLIMNEAQQELTLEEGADVWTERH